MIIGVPKETSDEESRVPLIPPDVKRLCGKGAELRVEAGTGNSIGIADDAYTEAGATVADRAKLITESDMILRLHKPPQDEVSQLKKGCIHVSFLDPFNERELVDSLKSAGVSALSMEMIPRSTIAQKMDALSSQANLAGYVTILLAAQHTQKIFPMMMTPSGTITPARVFVIGVGVAGLQAIATAKRLGARVEAFDTRPVVKEQVESLGAKFVEIDLGETGQTQDGYAKELTPEQIKMQQDGMAKTCATADIVVTTAALFGRKAPVIVTRDMVEAMLPGSVIVDMAVETGGNVEGSKPGQNVDINGVTIIGQTNLPGQVPVAASQMYSANLSALVEHFWDDEAKAFQLNREDDIIERCLITHDGELVNEMIKKVLEPEESKSE